MKNNMFKFFLVSDVIYQVTILSILYIMVLFFSRKGESWLYVSDILFVSVLHYSGSTGFSYMNHARYMNFGFCRKRFYREQVLLSVVRGGIYALVRTIVQAVCRDEYLTALVKDTQYSAEMYEQVPVTAMFIMNFGFFVLLNLILLVTVTCKVYPFVYLGEGSLQLKYRRQSAKNRNPLAWKTKVVMAKIGGLAVIIGFSLLLAYPGFVYQMYSETSARLVAVTVSFMLCIICIFIGKKRFRPENI